MISMTEKLNKKLENGEVIIGAYIFGGFPMMTEAISLCGYDVLWIDMEHTAIGNEALINNLIAAKAGGTPSWVRIHWNDPVLAKPVLDMGVDGIIFPYVRTADEARLAVQACCYPPYGIRGYGPLRALDYGAITQMEYVTETYKKCKRLIQLEHIDAVNNLEEIADVEGVDAFIVGPNDLSGSIGLIGQVKHPECIKLYEKIASILKSKNKPFGVATGPDEEFIDLWLKLGATIIFAGHDTGFVQKGAAANKQMLEGVVSRNSK